MTVDEKRAKKGFLWVDWLILAAVLAAIAGGIFLLRERRAAATENIPITYTLLIAGESATFGEQTGGWETLIPEGAAVSSSNGAIALGRVAEVRVQPHEYAVARGRTIAWEKDPDRVDLYVTVRANALLREGLRVSDVRITATDTGDYYLGGFYARGARVISVEREAVS